MNKDYVRTSVVAEFIDGLLEEKRALGFSYQFEEYLLNVFDQYCNENGLEDTCFSRQFLGKWLNAWGTESPSYHSQRISFVRQLSLYMNSLGIHAYVPVESVKKGVVVPHFLGHEELQAFFRSLDENPPHIQQPYAWRMWNTYRVIFRLIYSCGLRNSEACCLRTEDVDLDSGTSVFIILKAIKTVSSIFPAICWNCSCGTGITSARIWDTCRFGFFHRGFPKRMYIRQRLTIISIKHGCARHMHLLGKKPTVHCLRYSFVVDRMNAWIREGLSYDLMLPYLSKYLGHSGVEESMYYYHLNEEANIFIRKKDRTAGRVIPGVEKYGS